MGGLLAPHTAIVGQPQQVTTRSETAAQTKEGRQEVRELGRLLQPHMAQQYVVMRYQPSQALKTVVLRFVPKTEAEDWEVPLDPEV